MPAIIFVNKTDAPISRMSETVSALQTYSRHHIVLREVPIREGEEIVGVVDLVSERAWKFNEGEPSTLMEIPEAVRAREEEARAELLESYADFDDALLEEIIEDQKVMPEEVYEVASQDAAAPRSRARVPRLGRAPQRHHPADEGAAPRGARRSRSPASGSTAARSGGERRGRRGQAPRQDRSGARDRRQRRRRPAARRRQRRLDHRSRCQDRRSARSSRARSASR